MKKLAYLTFLLTLGLFITGCGGGDASEGEGAVNTGAGVEGDDDGEVDNDAGVGTDPDLMSKGVN
ncbi:MAG: hypothetical protein ABGZ53_29095 [Fuerstiella sp.]|nr:hypothetical protein [Fuerstiella sp.]